MARILVIEDEENLRFTVNRSLESAGHVVTEAGTLSKARECLAHTAYDLILSDIMLGDENGLDLVKEIREEGFDGAVVMMTAMGSIESAVEAMRSGADDYLQKPLSLEELTIQIDRWIQRQRLLRRVRLYQRLERTQEAQAECIGESQVWKDTLELASRLALIPLDDAPGASLPSILLMGETGVGKGVLARHIHSCAVRAARDLADIDVDPPLVHVNCSALPATLVEGELFGHAKGAFTDAREAKPGLFEMADGGTIFLDEISEMPLDLQSKLLIVVEQGTFRHVGSTRERHVRARVVAASNLDLNRCVSEGRFRGDLFYRLNTFTIQIPPLRDRPGDARRIATTMFAQYARQYGRTDLELSDAALEAIDDHLWPGNVRELVNVIQRASMLAKGPGIGPADLGLTSPEKTPDFGSQPTGSGSILRFDFSNGEHTAEQVEKALIMQALEHTEGNVSQASKLIGMRRSSLRYRIDRYGLADFLSEVTRR